MTVRYTTHRLILGSCLAVFLAACASQDIEEPDIATIEEKASATLATVEEKSPGFMDRLEASPGYAVIGMTETKVPAVGTGLGYGVIVDNLRGEHSYIRVTQLEVGAGLGAQRSKVIIVFDDVDALRRMIKGGLRYEGSAGIAVVEAGAASEKTLTHKVGRGYDIYRLTESGAIVSATVRVLRGQPYLPAAD